MLVHPAITAYVPLIRVGDVPGSAIASVARLRTPPVAGPPAPGRSVDLLAAAL